MQLLSKARRIIYNRRRIKDSLKCETIPINLDRMGKLNVALLRYLSREDFRILTAVSSKLYVSNVMISRDRWR